MPEKKRRISITITGNTDQYKQELQVARAVLTAFGASASQILSVTRQKVETTRQEVAKSVSISASAIQAMVQTVNSVINIMGIQLDPIFAAILDSVGVAAQVALQIAAIYMSGGPESPTFYQGILMASVTAISGAIGVVLAYQGRMKAQASIQQAQMQGFVAGDHLQVLTTMLGGM